MKFLKFIFLFFMLTATAIAGPGAIFNGENILLLKSNARFKGSDVRILTNDSDNPSSVAKDSDRGSIYIKEDDGALYWKSDDGSTTNWFPLVIGVSQFTQGSVVFADANGRLAQDNSNLFWDDTANELGILTNTPGAPLHVNGNSILGGTVTGVTQLDVDNLRLDANEISSTNANGDISLNPNGSGNVVLPDLTASKPLQLDASNNVTSGDIDIANDVTGVLAIANGGTNSSTALNNNRVMLSSGGAIVESGALTNGQLVIGSTGLAPVISTLSATANQTTITNGAGSITVGTVQDIATGSSPTFAGATISGLTANAPVRTNGSSALTTGSLNLASEVTNVLPIANGGTNSSTALNNDRIMVSSGGSVVEAAALTNGQLLIGSTGAAPVAATITGTANQVTVTPGAGSITLSTPQDIHTGANPTFAGALLTSTLEMRTNSALQLNNTANTFDVQITAPSALAADYSLVLPNDDGNANEFLRTDGSGNLTWAVAGGGAFSLTTISTTGAVATGDDIVLCDASSGNVTLQMYAVSGNSGRTHRIIKTDSSANSCKIDPNGAELIDGHADLEIHDQYKSVEITNNGAAWFTYSRSFENYCLVVDEKSSGTNGGNSTTATVHTRDLNTLEGECDFASISSNQLTLEPGTYWIRGACPAWQSNRSHCYLYNTGSTNIDILGMNIKTNAGAGTSSPMVESPFMGRIQITSSTTYEVRHFIETGATNGLGQTVAAVAGNPQTVERYTYVQIYRMDGP